MVLGPSLNIGQANKADHVIVIVCCASDARYMEYDFDRAPLSICFVKDSVNPYPFIRIISIETVSSSVCLLMCRGMIPTI
jgi:hypothetical protein